MKYLTTFILLISIISGDLFAQKADTISGYFNNDNIGGPGSVGRELEIDNKKMSFRYRYPIKHFKGWYDMKERIVENTGVQFGINYTALYMRSSAVMSGDNNKNSGSGILDLNVGWNFLNRKSGKIQAHCLLS